MLSQLQIADWIVLIILLLFMFGSSFLPAFKKKNAEEYFMADRSLRWWSVAGSIYGTNVSLQQIIGMLGIGYSIGFAQSHYEVLAIPAILLLIYVFVPIYRQKNFFTLSQFLEYRYNEWARLIYTLLIIFIIVLLVIGGFYIGSRQLGLIFTGSNFTISYGVGILIIAFMAIIFVMFGGMESVVIAENIQTTLMVIASVLVGVLAFSQPEIKGFFGLLQLDASMPVAAQKMHLYLPSNHPKLPWTGVFSGLLVLHSFFWTSNQFEVQRVMAAKTDRDAKIGAAVAGILKLSIPFFTIAAGVSATYIFRKRFGLENIQPDDAFLKLMDTVVPKGYGLVGLILAGFTAAIFSSIYSMLNSATTLLSMDIYKKYIHKTASDKQIVWFGRVMVVLLCFIAGILAFTTFDPKGSGNFFLTLSANTSYFKPGIVAVFFLGVFWKKAHPRAAVTILLISPLISLGVELFYNNYLNTFPIIVNNFGEQMNFFHRVFVSAVICFIIMVALSKYFNKTHPFTNTLNFNINIAAIGKRILFFLLAHLPLVILGVTGLVKPQLLSWPAAFITFAFFLYYHSKNNTQKISFLKSEHLITGLLSFTAVWILYFFA